MIGREATINDRSQIENFCCTGMLSGHEYDVEIAVCRGFAWWRSNPIHRLRILEHDGEIVAIAGFRPIYANAPHYGVFVEFLAVELTHQDDQNGTLLFVELIEGLAPAIAPGGYFCWHVHKDNERCLYISDKLGERLVIIDVPSEYVSFVTGIPEAVPSPGDATEE